MNKALSACALIVLLTSAAFAKDWPMYRSNPSRTASTTDSLPQKTSLRWKYRSQHVPQPAWPRSDRLPFDRAYQMVVAGGQVFFGSSVDNKVYALDAETGQEQWTFFTDAPIRFAPVAWQDRVFVTSDDGHLYALGAKKGNLLWKLRGGPDQRTGLGNERMIS